MRSYVTKQGDTWDLIAKRTLNNEYLMDRLMDANPEHIQTVIFPGGVLLVIPEIAEEDLPENLPPWLVGDGG